MLADAKLDKLFEAISFVASQNANIHGALQNIKTMIGEDETRLRDLENDMSRAYLEIEKLREQVDGLSSVSRQQTTEFTVPGIPSTLPEKDDDAVIAGVLGRIGAERFLPDITRVRRMKPRNSASEFWTLLVVCKSSVVRDEIVCLKIQKGDIAVSDIIPNQASAAERKLFLNEWLPRPVHELLQEVRSKARARGYQRVWIRDGVIFVRKYSTAQRIQINSKSDIDKIA
uniref:FP protein C-terminal domain-containing protein n=1 Tax=Trichogramma kaykai TaxID=54128 RepID=A0ABD2VWY9_9HYME